VSPWTRSEIDIVHQTCPCLHSTAQTQPRSPLPASPQSSLNNKFRCPLPLQWDSSRPFSSLPRSSFQHSRSLSQPDICSDSTFVSIPPLQEKLWSNEQRRDQHHGHNYYRHFRLFLLHLLLLLLPPPPSPLRSLPGQSLPHPFRLTLRC
jgi:hypothetical protein